MHLHGNGLDCELEFSSPNDEGWMNVSLRAITSGFNASFSFMCELQEWRFFIEKLGELESQVGSASSLRWVNMESNFELQIELTKTGQLEIAYQFSPNTISDGPTIKGSFQADQSYLKEWIEQAQEDIAGAN